MKPKLSYTIWFSQRTGSTLLCNALEATGIAGKPNEWLHCKPDLLDEFHQASYAELQDHLWNLGSTMNKVFGLKHSYYEPHFNQLIETLRKFPNCPPEETNRTVIWGRAFPNHRHIFMTRRNKVRLAVSWWKAIQSGAWHLKAEEHLKPVDISNSYSYDAINQLYNECSMREAGIQEFFNEGNLVPLTIFYEDFIRQYDQTIRIILNYLELDSQSGTIVPPQLAQTADNVSEEWVQRFRKERQEDWQNRGW
ncbi:MAG TPA: Stf0 family sulfotransferase [Anaerolineales bacterium]|nr:Stf0 family sulfotransferase [Anaerolineales bacterium]